MNCSGAAKVKIDRPQTLQVKEGHRAIDPSVKLWLNIKVMAWTSISNKVFWKAHFSGSWNFLWNCMKSLWKRKDSNSLILKASTRNIWQTFHFMLLFLLVGLGWFPAVIREGPEVFEILEEKCKFNSYRSSLEFLLSRLASSYQDWETKKNHGFWFGLSFFSDSLKLFRELPLEKKKKDLRKESFRYYPDSCCTKLASGLSAHEDL